MPNAVLLLGAGFSKNWGGLLASEVTNDLTARLQNNSQLVSLLNRMNFEDTLSRIQGDYLHSRTTEHEQRLIVFQTALSDMFDRMNRHFQSQQFEFSNDVSQSFGRFLTRFDTIFTLNQDLLLETHYRNDNAALWYG